MRREFILVLLGIICISTFSSLLSSYVHVEPDKVLIDTVAGSVDAGNFSYWALGYFGPLVIELTSLSGDADLYVADHIRPSYEVELNSYSSATCGPDIVFIPTIFPRPIGLGVFGHWSHETSQYSIQVFIDTSTVRKEEHMKAIEILQSTPAEKIEAESRPETQLRQKNSEKQEENKPRFLKLLNILDVVFEIFVA